jgi:hypothetical protein
VVEVNVVLCPHTVASKVGAVGNSGASTALDGLRGRSSANSLRSVGLSSEAACAVSSGSAKAFSLGNVGEGLVSVCEVSGYEGRASRAVEEALSSIVYGGVEEGAEVADGSELVFLALSLGGGLKSGVVDAASANGIITDALVVGSGHVFEEVVLSLIFDSAVASLLNSSISGHIGAFAVGLSKLVSSALNFRDLLCGLRRA